MVERTRSGDRRSEPIPRPADPILDVRNVPPSRRHLLIFQTFHDLAPGGAFVLMNDHDPKPLYYQFQAELPGLFDWEYLEEGPVTWRVRLRRPSDSPRLEPPRI